MDEPLRLLIEKGKLTGFVSVDEVNSVLADPSDTDKLAGVLDQLEEHGIYIDDAEQPGNPKPAEAVLGHQASGKAPVRRDEALLDLVRSWGIRASDAISRRDSEGGLFAGSLLVPGDAAIDTWMTLRARLDEFPHWPVIGRHSRGDSFPPGEALQGDAQLDFDSATLHRKAHELIAEAGRLPPEPWNFRTRLRSDSPPSSSPVFDQAGPRPSNPTTQDLAWLQDQDFMAVRGPLREALHPFIRIDLAPTVVPWQTFAYWPFGGWNAAPWPDEQLAMVRHWNEKFGAELISLSGDYFEMIVWNPPTTREAALWLAVESIWFGEETIFDYGDIPDDERVIRARNSRVWRFWWD